MQRSKTDAAGNKQQILPCKIRIYRKAVAIGAPNRNLLARLNGMKPLRNTAALFDGELQKICLCWAGRDGKQRFPYPRHGQHGTLPRNVQKGLFAVETHHPEGLNIWGIHADMGNDANHRNQRLFHFAASPIVFTTLTMFI